MELENKILGIIALGFSRETALKMLNVGEKSEAEKMTENAEAAFHLWFNAAKELPAFNNMLAAMGRAKSNSFTMNYGTIEKVARVKLAKKVAATASTNGTSAPTV